MGTGIESAREFSPEHAEAIDNMRDQLLIAFLRRLGGDIIMPVEEVDDTGQLTLSMSVDFEKREFNFVLGKKQ